MAYLSLLSNRNDVCLLRRIVNTSPARAGGGQRAGHLGEWRAMRESEGSGGGAGADLPSACRKAAPRLAARARAGLKELLALLQELGELMAQVSLSELARTLLTRSGLHGDAPPAGHRRLHIPRGQPRELVSDMAAYGTGADALTAVPGDRGPGERPGPRGRGRGRAPTSSSRCTIRRAWSSTGSSSPGWRKAFSRTTRAAALPRTSRRSGGCSTWASRGRASASFSSPCLNRRLFGRATDMSPSRFLGEIPPEALEVEEQEQGGGRAPWDGGRAFEAGGRAFPAGGRWTSRPAACTTTSTAPAWWSESGILTVPSSSQVRFTSGRVGKFLPKYSRLERIELST